jgi:type IV pilus assembly protein PilA
MKKIADGGKGMRNKSKGFSLIELLIVVAIILIIAAIAIPNMLKAREAANESSAVGSVRTINTGEVAYSASCPSIGFSSSLIELNAGANCAAGSNEIDAVLAGGSKSGYTFAYAGAPDSSGIINTYTIIALPGVVGTTGQRGFYSDQTGVIRYTLNGSAPTNASSALQ